MPALLPIDVEIVKRLAAKQLTIRQIAGVMGCDEKTLRNRFSAEMAESKAKGEGALVAKAVEMGLSGNADMLKFALKNKAAWSDKTTVETTNTNLNYNASEMSEEDLDAAIARTQEELAAAEPAPVPVKKANGKTNGHSH